jgi:hypothetical protein
LAKRRRSPVAIGTKSGRQRRATPLFLSRAGLLLRSIAAGDACTCFASSAAPRCVSKDADARRLALILRDAHACSRGPAPSRVRAAQHEMAFAAFHRSYDPSNIPHEGAPRER